VDSERDEAVTRTAILHHADALVALLHSQLGRLPITDPTPPPGAVARDAAVLAPLYVRDGLPCLLFTLRSPDLPKHRGEISFPGGSRERGDASLVRTALRETREELGLDPARVEILGPLPPVFAAVSDFLIQPYVGWLGEGLPPLAPNPAEVAEVIEAPLAALADPAIFHIEVWQRGGIEHPIHFYDFGSYRIWGATGRMLHSLLDLLPPE
jgi:8-oxo-dGTP pyrophosphatase MutT (NUDIX family)